MTFDQWCALEIGDKVRGGFGNASVIEAGEPDRGIRDLTLRYDDDARIMGGVVIPAMTPDNWHLDVEPAVVKEVQTSAPKTEKAAKKTPPITTVHTNPDGSALDRVPLSGGDRFAQIPIVRLYPSPTNPRRTFDQTILDELAESIKSHGIIQPIVVRESPGDTYEVVAGGRRLKASLIAKIAVMPCIVRSLTDVQVLEIQVLENNQREDVHPLEEAEAFERLLKQGAYGEGKAAVGILAEKLGRSMSYVYQRIKLLSLIDDARKEFLAGAITAGHAVQIARLTPETQSEILEDLLYQKHYTSEGDKLVRREECPSVRWLAERIGHLTCDLTTAAFDREDATLAPGSCTGCTKRTGFDGSLFGDPPKSDECLDRECFSAKLLEAANRRVAIAKAGGLIPICTAWRAEAEGTMSQYDYDKVAEDSPGAVRALVTEGRGIGQEIWIKPRPASRNQSTEEIRRENEEREAKLKAKIASETKFRQYLFERILEQSAEPDRLPPVDLLAHHTKHQEEALSYQLMNWVVRRTWAMLSGDAKKRVALAVGLPKKPELRDAAVAEATGKLRIEILLWAMTVDELQVASWNANSPTPELTFLAKTLGLDIEIVRSHALWDGATQTVLAEDANPGAS